MIIGVSGVAGAGKDSFFEILKDALSGKREVVRFAIADNLKEEVSEFCIEKYKIDPRNCSREDKDKIRHALVKYATEKRFTSQGRYWIEQIEEEIKSFKSSDSIAVITDVRFCDYEKDEVFWIKNEINGILLHISKFSLDENGFKHYLRGANEEEQRNDPLLYSLSDYKIEWPDTEKSKRKEMMNAHVNSFLKWYKKHVDKE